MKAFSIFILLLLPFTTHAETIKSKIYSIEENLIKLTNGRVAYLDKKQFNLSPGDEVLMNLDGNSSILDLKVLGNVQSEGNKKLHFLTETTPPPTFEPTIITNIAEAVKIFERSNPFYKRISECSDRAHVWAHEEFKLTGTKSMKAFVFFTASYINSVRFKWWFHVAPMYKVLVNDELTDLVMDFRYTDRPMSVKEWTDKFVYTKRPCKVTTKFSEYDVNPQTENCYLIFESMHYKIPSDIHAQELRGIYKDSTSESELKAAYMYGFNS